jgi:hypothetical protein
MWSFHIHRCRRKHGPSLTYTECPSPLTSTHMLGGCRLISNFRTQRHNSTIPLLHLVLRKYDGGRWSILGVNLGQKSVTDFKNIPPTTDDQIQLQLQPISHPSQEGLQDDKRDNAKHPQTIPDYILHSKIRPTHYRPSLIRAIDYITDAEGRLIVDPTFRGRRQIQII